MEFNSQKIAEKAKQLGGGAKQILGDASKKLNRDGVSATAAELGGKAKDQIRDITGQLKKHDFKKEVGGFFAEAKQDPSTLWKTPDSLRSGRELAVAGFAVAVIAFLFALITSSAFMGFICLVLGVGALLLSLLGLKTEGRKLAFGGAGLAFLVVICSLGQMFSSGKGGERNGGGGRGGEYPLLVANEGEESSVGSIFKMAQGADQNDSLNFKGFYPGMSAKNAKRLREHYKLDEDQIGIYFNVENGEVYSVFLRPKAVGKIMGIANNLEMAEEAIMDYFGISSWNNQKDLDRAEEAKWETEWESGSFTADFVHGEGPARQYNTADGVSAKLYPTGWNNGKGGLEIIDPKRKSASSEGNARFAYNNMVRKEWADLKNNATNKVEVKMLELPNGWDYLLKKNGDSWVSAFEVTKEMYKSVFKKKWDDNVKWLGVLDDFNSLQAEVKGDLVFRLLWREEYLLIPKRIRDKGKIKEKDLKALGMSTGLATEGVGAKIATGERWLNNFLIAESPDVAKKHAGRLSEPEVQELLQNSKDLDDFAWKEYHRQMAEYSGYKGKHGLTDMDMDAQGKHQPSYRGIKADKNFQKSYLESIGIVVEKGSKYFRASESQQEGAAPTKGELGKPTVGAEQKKAVAPEIITKLAENMVAIPEKGYSFCKYEVTQSLWEAVMGNNPSKFKGADLPVENVSWDDCQEFLGKLNEVPEVKSSGVVYRLPTEEEWQRAFWKKAEVESVHQSTGYEPSKPAEKIEPDKIGWYNENSERKTHPVGQKEPNAFGLYDMLGNVWEWTSTSNTNVMSKSITRVNCGGSWMDKSSIKDDGFGANRTMTADWDRDDPSYRDESLGFRLVSEKAAQ